MPQHGSIWNRLYTSTGKQLTRDAARTTETTANTKIISAIRESTNSVATFKRYQHTQIYTYANIRIRKYMHTHMHFTLRLR